MTDLPPSPHPFPQPASPQSASLWSRQDFIAALKGDLGGDLGGEVIGVLPAFIDGISIDSRTLNRGDAFFAIKGEQFDGHDFCAQAAKAGASVLVITPPHAERLRASGVPLVVVPDVLAALEDLGRAARARTKAKIICVTGSVGKTTTKEALRHLLGRVGRVHASPASFNNHWGVPLTLARLPQMADFAIFEIGMNHSGEIRPLVKMVQPHIAVITCIACVHSAYFSSIEEIACAKAEIFEGVEMGGTVLLNRDDEQFDLLFGIARATAIGNIVSFGTDKQADYRLIELFPNKVGSDCIFDLHGRQVQAAIGASGHHMAMNTLAALAICDILQQDCLKILPCLADFASPSGRGARHILHLGDGQDCLLLDESYNANPTSMRSALQVLGHTSPTGQGRRIAVLGDMLELGGTTRQAHEDLAPFLAPDVVEVIFLLGNEMRPLAQKLRQAGREIVWRATWQELVPLVSATLRSGDVITIKSSKSTGSSHIVAALLNQFSQ